jgi:hypothetical protein
LSGFCAHPDSSAPDALASSKSATITHHRKSARYGNPSAAGFGAVRGRVITG